MSRQSSREPRQLHLGLGGEDTGPSAIAFEQLRAWRRTLAADLGLAPYFIFNDATLLALAAALPLTREAFLQVKGTGESGWERFGAQVLEICRAAGSTGRAHRRARRQR